MRFILMLLFLCLMQASFAFDAAEKQQCEVNGIDFNLATPFVHDFKLALEKQDKNKIAHMMSYPVRVNKGHGKFFQIKTPKVFLAQFNQLFKPKMVEAILKDMDMFCNAQGAMLGNGAVWYRTEKDGAKIFVINLG